jgi:hypothetical protein
MVASGKNQAVLESSSLSAQRFWYRSVSYKKRSKLGIILLLTKYFHHLFLTPLGRLKAVGF